MPKSSALRVPQAPNGVGSSMPAPPAPDLRAAPISMAQRRRVADAPQLARASAKARAAWWKQINLF